MPDLHEVVDLGAGTDHSVVDAAAIDSRVGTDFDIVMNDAAADVRDLGMGAIAENVSETITSEPRTAVHYHAVA
jgi:hypothetical protein